MTAKEKDNAVGAGGLAGLETEDGRGRRDLPAGSGEPAEVVANATPERMPEAAAPPGMQVGPYRILSTLGEGGMGAVYLAQQTEPVERKVALKVIRSVLASATAIARFAAERQAMARLSHLNVAQMYEAGTTAEGRPYFAMEHVDGPPITEYCDRHALTIEQRLRLFMAACAGVQHAHQRGIIHRDIKPSNILVHEVDGQPVPKVIDFGIAKALDGSLTDGDALTGTGIVGTPSYMSPESLHLDGDELDIDTRTDVYALGVLLYTLLAGIRPFERKEMSVAQLLRVIAETDAPRPSIRFGDETPERRAGIAQRRGLAAEALPRRLAADLDWIVGKAIARQRDERYESVGELSADIARHLADQPVLATPPTLAYRARKFVRRHRVGVAAAGIGFALVVAFVAAILLQSARIAAERDRANTEAQARGAVSTFLIGLFTVSDPSEARGNTITARELLDRGAAKIDRELAAQPAIQAELMVTIGKIYDELSLVDQSQPLLRRAADTRERLLGEAHPDTLRAKNALGDSLLLREEGAAEALALFARAEVLGRQVLSPDDPELATPLLGKARILLNTGKPEEAERAALEGLSHLERTRGSAHPDTLKAVNLLADVYQRQGRYAEREQRLSSARAVALRALGEDHPVTVGISSSLAAAHFLMAHYDQAVTLFKENIALYDRIYGPESKRSIASRLNLSASLQLQGSWEEALALYLQNDLLIARVVGKESGTYLMNQNNLADLYAARGRYAEAVPLRRNVIEVRTRVDGPEGLGLLRTKFDVAKDLLLQGRNLEALPLLQESLATRARVLGEGHPETLISVVGLADAYRELDRYDEAEALYRRAWDLRKKESGEEAEDTLASMQALATLLMHRARLDEAEPLQRQALALREKVWGAEHWDTVRSTSALGALLVQQQRCDEARGLLEASYATAGTLKSDVRSALAEFHYNLASHAAACGEPKPALDHLRAVRDLGWKSTWIHKDPTFARLRPDAGFAPLAKAIGAP